MSRPTLIALGALVAAGTSAHGGDIDKSQDFYLASNLGKSVSPDFKGGTLRIDTSNATITQNFAVENVAGNTIDAFAHSATLSGVLSGAGDITFADSVGGGTVALSGINTYTGATTITGGTLALSANGSIASSSSVVDQATFDISATTSGASITSLSGTAASSVVLGSQALTITSGSGAFAGTISGTGKLVLAGGALYLTGENTYTGGTTVSAGTLYIGNSTASGSVIGDILDNGTVAISRTDAVTLSNNISGSGNLSQAGTGTLIIDSAQSYTGGTTITAGTLALTGAGSVASSSLITNSGTFDVSAANADVSIKSLAGAGNVILGARTLTFTAGTGTFSGVISGSGGVVVTGGTEVLAGTNTYTGGTTVTSGGTLKLGAGGTTGTIVGDIVDNGTVAFNFSSAVLGTTITGTGSVVQAGTGTTTLTTAQAYTGTTTISTGTLALAESARIASSSGVVDNGTFDISAMTSGVAIATLSGSGRISLGSQTLTLAAATGTFSGALTGTGSLEVDSGGETLAGTSSYTGATIVSAGASLFLSGNGNIASSSRVQADGMVDISASTSTNSFTSLTGSGTVSLGAQTLTLANAADTFAGSLTGTGGIVVNAGSETLTGNNTYRGSTSIYSGTLKLVGSGSIASSSGIQGFGTFDISGTTSGAQVMSLSGSGSILLGAQNLTVTAGSGTYAGAISGTGGLSITGGTQILAGANTYSGGTTIGAGGTLQLGGGTNLGSITGDVTDNGTLAFDLLSGSFSGIISGTGSVNQMGGTTILFGANTYGGGTTISGGTLQLGNGGTSGSILGNVSDSGTLVFNRSDAINFGGTISGTGGVTQKGVGTLTLTATNTYTGQTSIAAGTLALTGNGSIADSSQVTDNGVLDLSAMASGVAIKSLAGTGTVALGSQTLTLTAASGSFSGTISGSGGVTLTGGTQTLGGDNSYTGVTAVNAGTLLVDGVTTRSQGVTVASGGTLGGTGTVSSVTVANGGKISAGDTGVGTLHVSGNLQLGSGSITNVNVSSAGASELIVSNAATLGGTLTVTDTGGFAVGQKWTVLTAAGGLTGNLTLATTKSAAGNFLYALSQDANNVYLQINLANLSSLLPATATANERATSAGIDAAIASGASLPAAFENLGNLSGSTLTATLDELSGEVGADVAQAGEQAQAPFLSAMFDRMEAADAIGAPGAGRTWASFFGSAGKITGEATVGSHDLSQGAWGLAGGAEWDLSKALTAGIAISYGRSTVRVADGLGTGAVNAYQMGGYALMRWSPHLYGSLAIALGADTVHTHRVASTDSLEGSATALAFGARYETGIHFSWGTPYAALQGNWFNTPAYDEDIVSGPGTFALHYDARTNNRIASELGLKEAGHVKIADGTLLLSAQLAWAHDFTNTTNAFATFQNLANSGFLVQGARQAPDAGLVSLGAGYTTKRGIDLRLSLDTAFTRNSQSYAGNASVSVRW